MSLARTSFVSFVLAAAAVSVIACGERREAACPEGSILPGAASVTRFRDGPGRDLTDVVSSAEVVDIATTCRYDRRGVTVSLQVAIAATRGPADRSRQARYDYFVAITDPEGRIVAKEVFPVQFEFPEGQARTGTVDEIEPRIPLSDPRIAPDYRIHVGFQLTPEELAWNRSRRGP